MPNIPFFWILYRSYSNWRALKVSYILEFSFLIICLLVGVSFRNVHDKEILVLIQLLDFNTLLSNIFVLLVSYNRL